MGRSPAPWNGDSLVRRGLSRWTLGNRVGVARCKPRDSLARRAWTCRSTLARPLIEGLSFGLSRSVCTSSQRPSLSEVFQLGTSLIALAVFCGGVIVVLFLVYSGFLYATSGGEPQRVSQARSSLFMCLLGLLIMGLAFIIPRILSESVIEPAGGTTIGMMDGIDCDEVLKNQIIYQRSVRDTQDLLQLIRQIQNRYNQCSEEVWNPLPYVNLHGRPGLSMARRHITEDCGEDKPGSDIGGIPIPDSLRAKNSSDHGGLPSYGNTDMISLSFERDGIGNISVIFGSIPEWTMSPSADSAVKLSMNLPWNRQICWMYVARYSMWVGGGD